MSEDIDQTEKGLIYKGSLLTDSKFFRLFERGRGEQAETAVEHLHDLLKEQAKKDDGLHF